MLRAGAEGDAGDAVSDDELIILDTYLSKETIIKAALSSDRAVFP